MTTSDRAARALDTLTTSLSGRPIPRLVVAIGLSDDALLRALAAASPHTRVLALEPDAAAASAFEASEACRRWRAAGRLVYLSAPDYAGADDAWRVFPPDPGDTTAYR